MNNDKKIKILVSIPAYINSLVQKMLNDLSWNNSKPISQSELYSEALKKFYNSKIKSLEDVGEYYNNETHIAQIDLYDIKNKNESENN
ncbi:MAG: hypothetical protein V4538_00830 [Bacteroidota bacterium]